MEDADGAIIKEFLESVSAAPAPKPPPPIYFDVMRGEELLGRLDLSGVAQLTLGRDPSRVDIALEHASISRHHVTMTFDRNSTFVSDFGSTHGTFVRRDGATQRLKPTELKQLFPGDVLRFGESSRRYVFRQTAAHAAETKSDLSLQQREATTAAARMTQAPRLMAQR